MTDEPRSMKCARMRETTTGRPRATDKSYCVVTCFFPAPTITRRFECATETGRRMPTEACLLSCMTASSDLCLVEITTGLGWMAGISMHVLTLLRKRFWMGGQQSRLRCSVILSFYWLHHNFYLPVRCLSIASRKVHSSPSLVADHHGRADDIIMLKRLSLDHQHWPLAPHMTILLLCSCLPPAAPQRAGAELEAHSRQRRLAHGPHRCCSQRGAAGPCKMRMKTACGAAADAALLGRPHGRRLRGDELLVILLVMCLCSMGGRAVASVAGTAPART